LMQGFGEEEIDEVEEFEIENPITNWANPMKVEMIARKFDVLEEFDALYDLERQ